jgi:hypothetical protein
MSDGELIALVAVTGAVLTSFIMVPVLLHYRHERWKLRLEHERQLKALELGNALPAERIRESWFSPVRVGMMIGAGVPVGVFLAAMVTSIAVGFHDGIWISTCLVGLGAVISGSCVAARAHWQSNAPDAVAENKPFVEEDAYDVVSARG